MKIRPRQQGTWLRASVATLACVFGAAHAAVPSYRPNDRAQVVLRLGDGADDAALARMRNAVGAAPTNADALTRYVEALMARGAKTGSERFYGYAEQTLLDAPPALQPQLMLLHAKLLQHRHEFRDAERMLSGLLNRNPNEGQARLMRAQIRLHLNEPDAALRDCSALPGSLDLLSRTTCAAQARAAQGEIERSYVLINALLRFATTTDATRSWSAGVAAELAARLGKDDEASYWYRAAFEFDRNNHYARVAYADWLLAHGENVEAVAVAETGAAPADLLRIVLAKGEREGAVVDRLQLLWREAESRGEWSHLRDRARFESQVLRDSARAHATALGNFRDRREFDDAFLLATTSAALGDAAGLAAARSWRAAQPGVDRRFDRFLGARQ